MLGQTQRIADNLWFIQGEMPENVDAAPDWCNTVIYRAGDRLYLVDSSGGPVMRASIEDVLRGVGGVETVTLINTHGHLDHIGNNDVIAQVPATTRHHYLLRAGIRDEVLDGPSYFAAQFDRMDAYVDPLSGYQVNRARYRMARWIRDGLGLFVGRDRVLRWLFAVQLRKFRPVRNSRATMAALDDTPARPVKVGGVTWPGWVLGDGDVVVLEARAHTDHDVLVYIPEHRMLCMGDVTFPLFPSWADSSRERILECLRRCLAMTRAGEVAMLADGHGDRCYIGAGAVAELLDTVLADHLAFARLLAAAFRGGESLTPGQVYRDFRGHAEEPVVAKYLALEFPTTPPGLQNVITTALLQMGYRPHGRRRHQRFTPPADHGAE
jgi:glyoxylase-like metal-dependent hydrolase (beta-lactamase superfamily II)